jgi:radical SAM superfamily enzyme with C-terminal helix-hairpin-helix motif
VAEHPDLGTPDRPGPLTYEVEVYQGCVRYKRGCKFCIEPKKGAPLWRTPEDIIEEVRLAHEVGVQHVRLGGMTDTYTYMAEGVQELEYPVPNPEPIARLLHGLRDDDRLCILHTDNGNPSIIAENLEPSEAVTKTLVETLSDGAVLSFGLESADPSVHEANWLNCDPAQLKTAIRLINKHGRVRGERGLPKLLPGLNFIAGLNGETEATYGMNMDLLRDIRNEGLLLRRINIRQVEGEGFQEIPSEAFTAFKMACRDEIDRPLLKELFPLGHVIHDVHWESHDGRTRLPVHETDLHRAPEVHGQAGITFGRQIGAYPILIGAEYKIPLETQSSVLITGHGARSITGVEVGLNPRTVSQKQLEAFPGLGKKSAWNLVAERAKMLSKGNEVELEGWFERTKVPLNDTIWRIFG